MSKTALLFPGQGAQQVGMGRDLVESSDHAARVFNRANEILGFDLSGLCFDGPPQRLEATDIQQPAILVTSVAFWAVITEGGGRKMPISFTAGLSLGEYTALHAAGVLSFEDAVRLVHQRGLFMQQAATTKPSAMVSVLGMDGEQVERLCERAADGQVLQPSNFNCPGQIVISGEKAACERAMAIVEADHGKAIMLKVAGAFHSDLMKPAAEKLKTELEKTTFEAAKVPVISNVDARAHGGADDIRDALYRQVFSPVRWQSSIECMIQSGCERFVELGPGRSLTGLMRKIDRSKTCVNVSNAESCKNFGEN